ncbi:protein-glutamate methylesterase/protein-glutamine glutaminase [Planctobacterium marinum]|uniref:protein-glutamate methylesterase/protein-glutamine glutaminase n=1 Tax=Planctobacterium marinum TaxID=1631968 RepID=UPI001E474361|nr:chemotaxis response regulator protein-glutamate methylesterase [Planctobacterium marinum]MCC2606186.1 chemotaxis response regulator protein-glutamate methylesterase [Planctobacterium marinum]
MPYKVLVVDDSTFFRRRVSEILNQSPDLEVVGDARNGKEAIESVKRLNPDVVTMDIEMPVMDGISAVKEIMRSQPVPIIMFSSLTYEGAQATLDALEAGAMDFLPKRFEDIARDRKEAVDLLQQRVKALGPRKLRMRAMRAPASSPSEKSAPTSFFLRQRKDSTELVKEPVTSSSVGSAYRASGKRYKLLAIGTSTGGPVALQTILTKFRADFPHPILLVQHMPGTFTSAFAERLNNMCEIKVKEAQNGDVLTPGVAYLAPGGRQMLLDGTAARTTITITDVHNSDLVTYKPSVDLTFSSVARLYGGEVLGIILTGMGADGKEGCKKLKARGATIWAQDERSSVVYGMPQAVASEKIAEKSIALMDFAEMIQKEM